MLMAARNTRAAEHQGMDAADVGSGFGAAEFWGVGGVGHDCEALPRGEVGLDLSGVAW